MQEQKYQRQISQMKCIKMKLVQKLEELKRELTNMKGKNSKMKKFVEIYTLRVNEQIEENQIKVKAQLQTVVKQMQDNGAMNEENQILEKKIKNQQDEIKQLKKQL